MKSKSVAASAENLDREVAQSVETRPQPLIDQVGKTASHFCFFHLRELLDGEAYAT